MFFALEWVYLDTTTTGGGPVFGLIRLCCCINGNACPAHEQVREIKGRGQSLPLSGVEGNVRATRANQKLS